MNLVDLMKLRVLEGLVDIPETPNEWVLSLDKVLSLSDFDFDVNEKIEELKKLFLTVYKTRADDGFCYTSRVSERVLTAKNKKFNDAYKFVFGVDALSEIIRHLEADGVIRVEGKKTYLINQ